MAFTVKNQDLFNGFFVFMWDWGSDSGADDQFFWDMTECQLVSRYQFFWYLCTTCVISWKQWVFTSGFCVFWSFILLNRICILSYLGLCYDFSVSITCNWLVYVHKSKEYQNICRIMSTNVFHSVLRQWNCKMREVFVTKHSHGVSW